MSYLMIKVNVIFNDQSFKDMLTNDIVSFEQLGPDFFRKLFGCGYSSDCLIEAVLLTIPTTYTFSKDIKTNQDF